MQSYQWFFFKFTMDRANLKVFCFIRIIEFILSVICYTFHIFQVSAVLQEESFPFKLAFQIIYLSFVIFSAFLAVAIFEGFLNFQVELASALAGFIFFIFASIYSMIVVENDPHLPNLSEEEEYNHLFFKINRFQSVLALFSGMFFLLHSTFTVDLLMNKPPDTTRSRSRLSRPSEDSDEVDDSKPLKLVFFPQTYYMKFFKRTWWK